MLFETVGVHIIPRIAAHHRLQVESINLRIVSFAIYNIYGLFFVYPHHHANDKAIHKYYLIINQMNL